jgi:hypothetical protein
MRSWSITPITPHPGCPHKFILEVREDRRVVDSAILVQQDESFVEAFDRGVAWCRLTAGEEPPPPLHPCTIDPLANTRAVA